MIRHVIVFVLGAASGFFLNRAAYRTVRGRRRRGSRTGVPAGTLLAAAGFGLYSVLLLLRFELSFLFLRSWLFACCLFFLALTDAKKRLIPNACIAAAALIFLVFIPLIPLSLKQAGLQLVYGLVFGGGILLLSLLLDRLLGRNTLGGGDVKLIFILGLYLRPTVTLLTLLAACLAALLFIEVKKKQSGDPDGQIPFGPFLAGAAALMLLTGDRIADWILKL